MQSTSQDLSPTPSAGIASSASRPRPWRLFPHPVARIAGLPYEFLDELKAREAASLLEEAAVQRRAMESLAEGLKPLLYEAIGRASDADARRHLLALRRDLHNLRPVRRSRLEALCDELPREVIADCARYRSHAQAGAAARQRALAAFEAELPRIRRQFQAALGNEDFLGALALSSPTLCRQLDRYRASDPARPGAKARQVERSLLRYLSRAVTKTTPFSTFCAIGPARLEVRGAGSREMAVLGDPSRKGRRVRINKGIYGALLPALHRLPDVRRRFGVELNSTLVREPDHWRYLTLQEGREVFQRLRPLPSFGVLDEVLGASRPSYQELVSRLASDPRLASDENQAAVFVDRLLELGLLRYRVGISEQEADWDLPLGEILAGVDDPAARRIADSLIALRERAGLLPSASPARRVALVESTETMLAELFESLAVPPPPGDQPPFYEDAVAEAVLSLPSAGVSGAARCLAELVDLLAPVASPRIEQLRMAHFFAEHYGPDRRAVPLLRFYEDYYREHFKAHLELQARADRGSVPPDEAGRSVQDRLIDPFGQASVEALRAAVRRLQARVAELWRRDPEAPEIRLGRRDLVRCLDGVPATQDRCRSVSVFAQPVPTSQLGPEPDGARRHGPRQQGGGHLALVLDGWFAGYGKYVSRFLYLLPEEIEQGLRDGNQGLSRARLAEICGDAQFNGNLHPPLMPWEIDNPTGETSGGTGRLAVTDLQVAPDPDHPDHLLLLHGATGQRVLPVDLGFLNPLMRPPLFQLLATFSPVGSLNPVPLPTAFPSEPSTDPDGRNSGLRVLPRITYRGQVVLARRQWEIGPELFPQRRAEAENAYLLRLDRWRRDLGLPERCFFRVRAERVAERAGGAVLRKHLYKPQFLDFSSPLLVDLFSRAVGNLERYRISFEEALPDPALAPSGATGRWASEVVLQLDYPEPGSGERDV